MSFHREWVTFVSFLMKHFDLRVISQAAYCFSESGSTFLCYLSCQLSIFYVYISQNLSSTVSIF